MTAQWPDEKLEKQMLDDCVTAQCLSDRGEFGIHNANVIENLCCHIKALLTMVRVREIEKSPSAQFVKFVLVTFGFNEDGMGDIFTREGSIAAAEDAVKRGIIHSFKVIDGEGGGWIEAVKRM